MTTAQAKEYNDDHIRQKTDPNSISTDEVATAIDNVCDIIDDIPGGTAYTGGTDININGSNVVSNTSTLNSVTGRGNTTTNSFYSTSPNGVVGIIDPGTGLPNAAAFQLNSGTPIIGIIKLGVTTNLDFSNRASGTKTLKFPDANSNDTLAVGATDGSTTVRAGSNGIIDLSSLSLGGGGGVVDYSFQSLTDGATIDIDYDDGINFKVTIAGNRNITFSNPVEGKRLLLKVTQDATGGRTLTFPAGSLIPLGFGTGTTVNLTTAGGAVDMIEVIYDGTNYFITPAFNYQNT